MSFDTLRTNGWGVEGIALPNQDSPEDGRSKQRPYNKEGAGKGGLSNQ